MGILVDPTKIQAIQTFLPFTPLTEVCPFMGLASYHKQFGKDFAQSTSLIANHTKSNVQFV